MHTPLWKAQTRAEYHALLVKLRAKKRGKPKAASGLTRRHWAHKHRSTAL